MSGLTHAPPTPLTTKADRSDRRIRLLEEAILMLRGEWPSVATGLCMNVNSLYGFTLTGKEARRRMVNESVAEATRLVELLYGENAIAELYQRATTDHPDPEPINVTQPSRSQVGDRLRAPRAKKSLFHRGTRLT